MALFSCSRKSAGHSDVPLNGKSTSGRLPANFVQRMREFGEINLTGRASADTYPRYIAPYFDWSYKDPDGFASAVADAVIG